MHFYPYNWLCDCLFVLLCLCLLLGKLCIKACVCHLTSYSVVQLRGLRLPSNTGLYDRARPGACSCPSLPWRVMHGRSRPASPSAQWANLTIMVVEISVGVGPPRFQYSWGRARTRAPGLVRYRGLLCARVGHGWARLSYTAACLAGNLLTQLWLAQILSKFGPDKGATFYFLCRGLEGMSQ